MKSSFVFAYSVIGILLVACSGSDDDAPSAADSGAVDSGQGTEPREAGSTPGDDAAAPSDAAVVDAGRVETGTSTDPTLDAGGANGIVYAFDGKATYATKSSSVAAISANKVNITASTGNPGAFQDIITIQVVNAVGDYSCSAGEAALSLSSAAGPVYQANATLGSCSVHVTKAAAAAQDTLEATFSATVKNVQGADTHQITSGSIKAVRTI